MSRELVLPPDFGDYGWEVESKGWFSAATVRMGGTVVDVTFYDPVRLSQDVEAEIEARGRFEVRRLLVVPAVTEEAMREAVSRVPDEFFLAGESDGPVESDERELSQLQEWREDYGVPELQLVLARAWDPIGVYGDGRHSGEYDSYAERVLDALEAGATTDDLQRILERFSRDEIGMPDPSDGAAEGAAAIASWYVDAMERLSARGPRR